MRAQLLEAALGRVAMAYQHNHEDLNTNSLWSQVEDALNLEDGELGRRTITDIEVALWRQENANAAKARGLANNTQ